ncbi:hypothetical protein ACQP2F_34265 [Actinoplanes sp. CA-030573]|uniref:hypothetical protein n=1 Tax=Actinoplanes sp. CA-030573 TaxID=3239898 RepID=UPI003D8C363E
MATRRRWPYVLGGLVVLVVAVAGIIRLVRDPHLLPGDRELEVYAVDDAISTVVDEPPGVVGRALGMCDADTYYARDGDRKLCLVLSGPLGTVRASRGDGKVTVAAGEVPKLKGMAAQDRSTTTLVLMAGGPAALIPVRSLTEGQPIETTALS